MYKPSKNIFITWPARGVKIRWGVHISDVHIQVFKCYCSLFFIFKEGDRHKAQGP